MLASAEITTGQGLVFVGFALFLYAFTWLMFREDQFLDIDKEAQRRSDRRVGPD